MDVVEVYMGRISEKNKRFRSKETIINDVYNVLKSDLSYGTKFAVIHDVTWVWTEFYGKYVGCPYWSEEALKLYKNKNEIINFSNGKYLRHEHIVPRNIVINELLNLKEITKKKVKTILENTLIGVIITKEEDKLLLKDKMPAKLDGKSLLDYTEKDKWLRYILVDEISVCRVEWTKDRNRIISSIAYNNIDYQ